MMLNRDHNVIFIILISDCYASLMMLDRDHCVILLY